MAKESPPVTFRPAQGNWTRLRQFTKGNLRSRSRIINVALDRFFATCTEPQALAAATKEYLKARIERGEVS